jgi:hypothetical protein
VAFFGSYRMLRKLDWKAIWQDSPFNISAPSESTASPGALTLPPPTVSPPTAPPLLPPGQS